MPDVAYCPECNQPVVADAESCNHCGAEVGPGLDRADIWLGLRDKLAAATSDNYEVDGLIGYGGMAGVYLAKDTRLNRYVALKLITPAVLMDPKMVRRFRQEAQTMAQLNHRHIVPVYDIRESDDLLFIVMQYVPGRTLAEVVTDSRERLPPELVATWMIQISDALAHAHGRPTAVIHRDIKPSNIILDETGEAQLTDFGIAKVQGDAGLTRTGHLIGTPAYMSPEQCRGAVITAASDQYSLGTVASELLAGVPPFRGPTLMVLPAPSGEEP
ncbi:MAG: serine/threonine-protein kinase, partial [Longimicrobiales bacterium]